MACISGFSRGRSQNIKLTLPWPSDSVLCAALVGFPRDSQGSIARHAYEDLTQEKNRSHCKARFGLQS